MEGQARTHFSLGESSRNQPRAAHAAASRLPRKDRCVPLKRTARQVARLRRLGFQDGIVGLLASQLRVRQRVQGRQVGVRTVEVLEMAVEVPEARLLAPVEGLVRDFEPQDSPRAIRDFATGV